MAQAKSALDFNTMRANARIWRERAGGRLRAVVKSDAYGWGLTRVVRELESEVDGFCVLDLYEFRAIREYTQRPVTILGFCTPGDVTELLQAGALPNVATLAELEAAIAFAEAAGHAVRIRAGLSPALGWNGVAAHTLGAFAERAGAHPLLELELWTHLTAFAAQAAELEAFRAFVSCFERSNANIAGIDVANSGSLALSLPEAYRSSRIGIGLFGDFKSAIPELRNAVSLEAPVVDRMENANGMVSGYARRDLPPGRFVETLRVGYGDGLPRGLIGACVATPSGDMTISTIGMQHTVVVHDMPPALSRSLLHPGTDLQTLCSGTTTTTHELIVGLGIAAKSV